MPTIKSPTRSLDDASASVSGGSDTSASATALATAAADTTSTATSICSASRKRGGSFNSSISSNSSSHQHAAVSRHCCLLFLICHAALISFIAAFIIAQPLLLCSPNPLPPSLTSLLTLPLAALVPHSPQSSSTTAISRHHRRHHHQQQQQQEEEEEGEAAEAAPSPAAPPRLFLYRLIGNSLPPLQCNSQLLLNTRFALHFEPPVLPAGRRLWVLNNIVNETEQALLIDLLLRHGYGMEDILVRRVDYDAVARHPRERWTEAVSAQNEARNFIIRHGIANGARWILAFDGNQFFTDQSWASILAAADRWEQRGLKYFKVPMYRVYERQHPRWLNAKSTISSIRLYTPFLWESQMAFRNDSDARYVEGMVYGKDNKLELIDRVCGTGRFENDKRKTHGEEVAPSDTRQCGCHREVGNDRKIRPRNEKAAVYCGYSIRLWYHPCSHVDAPRIFKDKRYRARLREEGHKLLQAQIVKEVRLRNTG